MDLILLMDQTAHKKSYFWYFLLYHEKHTYSFSIWLGRKFPTRNKNIMQLGLQLSRLT